MQDVPKDLLAEIERLEKLFTVPAAKLKEITDHFITELVRGNLLNISQLGLFNNS